jgi:hypothetical protein
MPMDLESKLHLIEEGFWLQGQDHFLEHLDECCLLAFPQAGEIHGVFDRKNVAATATASNRWRDLRMYARHLLEAGDVAIISYRAEDGRPYAALVSSGYVRRADAWKLAFHQHSPFSLQDGSPAEPSDKRTA